MLDAPAAEQLPGCVGGELWSAVGCQRRGYPERCKCVPQGVGQSRGAVGGWGDDGPARVIHVQGCLELSAILPGVLSDLIVRDPPDCPETTSPKMKLHKVSGIS